MSKYIYPIACALYGLSLSAVADDRSEALLQTLHRSQPKYIMRDEDYRLDPKMLKNSHVVDWVQQPIVDISRKDFIGYVRPVEVEMTVIAATGKIAVVKLIRSSGSKLVDQKVKEAITQAVLGKIPYADANVTYQLSHRFDVEKPL